MLTKCKVHKRWDSVAFEVSDAVLWSHAALGSVVSLGKDRRPSKGPGSIGRHGVVGAEPRYDRGRRALLACASWLARQFSAAACTTHVSSGPVRGDAPGRRRLPVGKLALAGTLVLKHGG